MSTSEMNKYQQDAFDFLKDQQLIHPKLCQIKVDGESRKAQSAIEELNQISQYASLLVSTTLQSARQVFDIQSEGNDMKEAIWHTYAQAYTHRVQHEVNSLAEQITRTLTQGLVNELLQRGLYEIRSMVKDIKKSMR